MPKFLSRMTFQKMFKKLIYIFFIFNLLTSCGGSFDSFKRALTGQKQNSTDEFMIQKKDPLVLPPDYENLPTPDERIAATEELSSFEIKLEDSIEEDLGASGSTEESILKKIRKK